MSENQIAAMRLLKAKNGATIEQITKRLKLKQERQARGLIDRLREKGMPVKNVEHRRFKLVPKPLKKAS